MNLFEMLFCIVLVIAMIVCVLQFFVMLFALTLRLIEFIKWLLEEEKNEDST